MDKRHDTTTSRQILSDCRMRTFLLAFPVFFLFAVKLEHWINTISFILFCITKTERKFHFPRSKGVDWICSKYLVTICRFQLNWIRCCYILRKVCDNWIFYAVIVFSSFLLLLCYSVFVQEHSAKIVELQPCHLVLRELG